MYFVANDPLNINNPCLVNLNVIYVMFLISNICEYETRDVVAMSHLGFI